jgi:hypothetical protein
MRIVLVAAIICGMAVPASVAQTVNVKPETSAVPKPEALPSTDASGPATGTTGQPNKAKTEGENPSPRETGKAPAGSAADSQHDKSEKAAPPQYYGHFDTNVLAGGTTNALVLPFARSLIRSGPAATFRFINEGIKGCDKAIDSTRIAYTKSNPADAGETLVGIELPSSACWYLLSVPGSLKVTAEIGAAEPGKLTTLFDETVHVSGLWLPLLITLLIVALTYPGCAAIYYFMRQRNNKADLTFLQSLDPVQITANPYGRGSLGKLQIFLFTLIVFGLLIFYLLRSGVIASMSTDVMLLLGISAAGAVGGKIAYRANRRVSFENWAWLIRNGWLPDKDKRDIAPQAHWRDLFLDGNTDEFDPYAFQMAVFSLVVAIALVKSTLAGLGTFKIPAELLELLGISQAVYIGGAAIDKTGFPELDKKLDEIRQHEKDFANAKTPDEQAAILKLISEGRAQAARMFSEIYTNQLPHGLPDAVKQEASRPVISAAAAPPAVAAQSGAPRNQG